jgi:hypothetical protein
MWWMIADLIWSFHCQLADGGFMEKVGMS